ncbi:MAG: mandelate racemase/muconate lactonizing enzyme family protein [Gaiellales bacterium]
MQIRSIRAIPVNIPFVAPYRFAFGSTASLTKTLVEVITDDGIVGWGEAADGDRSAAIEAAGQKLIGLDPLDLDAIEAAIVPGYAYSPWADVLGAKRTFGAIELALWDIRGKVEGRPLFDLLGGAVRTEIPLTEYFSYRFAGPDHPGESTPLEIARECARLLEEFDGAIFEGKVGTVGADEELAMVREIRAAIGERPLRLDGNGGWLVKTARELIPCFEEFTIDQWEDPVEGYEDLAAIRDVTDRPFSSHIIDLPLAKALGVPNVIVTNLNEQGGIRRTVEFVRACQSAGVGFRFHSGETGVASTAYLHVTAAIDHIDDASQTLFRWYADDVIVGGPYVPRHGVVPVPTGPGLGIEIDPVALDRCHRRFLAEGSFPGADGAAYGQDFRRR